MVSSVECRLNRTRSSLRESMNVLTLRMNSGSWSVTRLAIRMSSVRLESVALRKSGWLRRESARELSRLFYNEKAHVWDVKHGWMGANLDRFESHVEIIVAIALILEPSNDGTERVHPRTLRCGNMAVQIDTERNRFCCDRLDIFRVVCTR